jgi:hypothetical protein
MSIEVLGHIMTLSKPFCQFRIMHYRTRELTTAVPQQQTNRFSYLDLLVSGASEALISMLNGIPQRADASHTFTTR